VKCEIAFIKERRAVRAYRVHGCKFPRLFGPYDCIEMGSGQFHASSALAIRKIVPAICDIRGCIQKFPDRVDSEIYAYSLRSNTKGYGGKTH
jgi:hypothetical protein